ncbi:hypothetical protein AciPR4_0077 [Terriglobus saanensis SP1PR4]|uniref:Uncharacterized protein n=2 Tax=Terriglobus saanensis TaxID=870903 RepID=E8UYA8_TERSS|nr:hypothetical protein AciPR4_0077 [Terriglobus saanensis SP1PR4]
MLMKRRRSGSISEVIAGMNELAVSYGLPNGRYDALLSEEMDEFDALKWVTLSAQRETLLRLEDEKADATRARAAASDPFAGVYKLKRSAPVALTNSPAKLEKLAA